jgi:hypothetical protein
MRVFLLINMLPDLRLAYPLSQTGSNREMFDAGETHHWLIITDTMVCGNVKWISTCSNP